MLKLHTFQVEFRFLVSFYFSFFLLHTNTGLIEADVIVANYPKYIKWIVVAFPFHSLIEIQYLYLSYKQNEIVAQKKIIKLLAINTFSIFFLLRLQKWIFQFFEKKIFFFLSWDFISCVEFFLKKKWYLLLELNILNRITRINVYSTSKRHK